MQHFFYELMLIVDLELKSFLYMCELESKKQYLSLEHGTLVYNVYKPTLTDTVKQQLYNRTSTSVFHNYSNIHV